MSQIRFVQQALILILLSGVVACNSGTPAATTRADGSFGLATAEPVEVDPRQPRDDHDGQEGPGVHAEGVSVAGTAGGGHGEHSPMAAIEPLPGQSIYHLDSIWADHHGREVSLADFRGHPTVVVLFYASCETACPILVRDVLRLEENLPSGAAEDTRFVMVTIDPERDAPERLARYVRENELEAPNWHFLTGAEGQTRALAALLGVQYRPAGNGMFSHTNLITVLDEDGVVVSRTEGLNQPVEAAVEGITEMLAD